MVHWISLLLCTVFLITSCVAIFVQLRTGIAFGGPSGWILRKEHPSLYWFCIFFEATLGIWLNVLLILALF